MANKKTLKKDGFDLFSKEILAKGATYTSFMLLDEEKSITHYKSTDAKWHERYVINEFYKDCHLIKRTNDLVKNIETPSFTLLWDSVQSDNEVADYINCLRKENNICHGVAFCNKNFHYEGKIMTLLVTIAGRNCDINFSSHVLKDKKAIYNSIINSGVLKDCLILNK